MDVEEFIKESEKTLHRIESVCINLEKISSAIEAFALIEHTVKELRSILHDTVNINGLYAQTQSALRGLSDRVAQTNFNQESTLRALESNREATRLMAEYFKIMSDRLDDIIKCPFPSIVDQIKNIHEHAPSAPPPKDYNKIGGEPQTNEGV